MILQVTQRPSWRLVAPLQCNIRSFANVRLRTHPLGRYQEFATKVKRRTPAKAVAYETHGTKLANRSSPTLLYKAHSNMPYIIGCYSVGSFLLTCGMINNGTKNLALIANVPAWVPLFAAVGSFAMLAVGAWICMRPQNMVKSITAIPSKEPGSRSILLQVERSRSVPFVTPRTYVVPPRDVTMSSPLFLGDEQQILAEIAELQRQDLLWMAFDKDSSPRTLPFRMGGYYTTAFFRGVKKAFTGSDLIKFHIKGNNFPWKMETKAAWALEQGRTLDGMVRIRGG